MRQQSHRTQFPLGRGSPLLHRSWSLLTHTKSSDPEAMGLLHNLQPSPLLLAFQTWKFPGSKDGLMESRAAFLSYEDLPSLTEKGRGVCAPALHCPPAPLCLGSSMELCKTLGGTGSMKCCWGDRWAQRTDSQQSCLLQALSIVHDRLNDPCSCPGWIITNRSASCTETLT